MCIRRFSIYS
jgi:hypothetical protein